jgi:hypothetical protein
MVRIIRYLQTSQRRPPGYIVENVPVVSSSRSRTLESMHKIHGILGVPVLIDAAAVGSRAHHPRFWWTNLAPAELLQSAIGRTRRPDVYVSDILDPHRTHGAFIMMIKHLLRSSTAKENHLGPFLLWLALPVRMPLRITDRGSFGTP